MQGLYHQQYSSYSYYTTYVVYFYLRAARTFLLKPKNARHLGISTPHEILRGSSFELVGHVTRWSHSAGRSCPNSFSSSLGLEITKKSEAPLNKMEQSGFTELQSPGAMPLQPAWIAAAASWWLLLFCWIENHADSLEMVVV